MKIGLVCKNYSSRKGGLERYTVFLSRELVRSGHEVHIFANTSEENSGVILHAVPMIPFSLPLKNISFAFFSKQVLQTIELDVIHSMERTLYQDIYRASDGIVPMHLSQRYPNPAVRRLMSFGPRRLVLRYLEKKIFLGRACKVIMTNSHLVKNQIIQYYHVHPGRIKVIYNGVATERFSLKLKRNHRQRKRKTHGIREEEILLLFVSNDHRRKGLKLLLEGVYPFREENMRVMVVGSDDKEPYRQWAARTGLEGKVLFLGPVEDIEKYYAAADIFVLPTRYDPFSNACLEAMACGLPVITTTDNGASELIQDGVNGFILKTRKPDELASQIVALRSLKERVRMGENAARKAKDYTMEKHVQEVLELYNRIKEKGGL